MFKISQTTLGSAVATNGTITFSYPSGSSAGSFVAYGHKIWVDKLQKLLSSPSNFTVSFGASNITVTYLGSTTIPAGARLNAQFNIEGTDDNTIVENYQNPTVQNAAIGNIAEIILGSPATADVDGFCVSQDLTSAGVFSSSVTAAAAIAAAALAGYPDVPRNVVAAWTGTAVLTITGKDQYGNTMIESSASGTSLTGKKAFKQITGISSSANITSLTVGTGDVLGLPFFVGDAGKVIVELKNGTTLAKRAGKVILTGQLTASEVDAGTPLNLASPVAGNIRKLTTTVNGTVTTGGDVTVKIGTTDVTGLVTTVANSATAGTVYQDEPTTLGASDSLVAVGSRIQIVPAAAFNGSGPLDFMIEIDVTAAGQLDGTFVAGVSSAATATTGDIRGTYDPVAVCDGSTAFKLIVESADPKYLGVAQYGS